MRWGERLFGVIERWLNPRSKAALDSLSEVNERRIQKADEHAADRAAAEASFSEQTRELEQQVARAQAMVAARAHDHGAPPPQGAAGD